MSSPDSAAPVSLHQTWDVVVIGAGAAGLFCAGTAGQRGRRVLVLDHADKPGKKILISGGGRCNFTNRRVGAENFLSQNPHFCRSALARFKPDDFIALVERYGISYHEREHGQLFCDDSAKDIVRLLLAECDAGGVMVRCGTTITAVERLSLPSEALTSGIHAERGRPRPPVPPDGHVRGVSHAGIDTVNDECHRADVAVRAPREEDRPLSDSGASPCDTPRFRIVTDRGVVSCRNLVLATGGLSVPTIGASDFGFRLAKQFGLNVIPTAPALVPFTVAPDAGLTDLSGIAVPAVVTTGGISFRENVLFTHGGLSGPAILQASSYWRPGEEVVIDWLPDVDVAELLTAAKAAGNKQLVSNWLADHLPKRLAQRCCDVAREGRPVHQLSAAGIAALGTAVNAWTFVPAGTDGYRKAEVTRGGIDTKAFSSQTLECRTVPGLYAVGEVLDVTGWLGGFNFQWAWASGRAVGMAV
jgi:predicted flavoprotein YhiN